MKEKELPSPAMALSFLSSGLCASLSPPCTCANALVLSLLPQPCNPPWACLSLKGLTTLRGEFYLSGCPAAQQQAQSTAAGTE